MSASRIIAGVLLALNASVAGFILWALQDGRGPDAEGRVTVTPPWAGTWMASVVHMVPATDSPNHDWDSHWGNLTFALPR